MATQVTDIPGIMQAKGWLKGQALMQKWLRSPANADPAKGRPDTTTITMKWVRGFAPAAATLRAAVADRVWVNDAARVEILRMLHRGGHLGPNGATTCSPFGNVNAPMSLLDRDYVQYRTVGSSGYQYYGYATYGYGYYGYPYGAYGYNGYDYAGSYFGANLNDLTAALGRFAFRFAVEGIVDGGGGSGRWSVTVHRVAIYIRDSYDFNGDQHLGYWDKDDNSVSIVNPLSGTKIENADFRDYRQRTGLGGDYFVYSDVEIRDTKDTFWIQPVGHAWRIEGSGNLVMP